MHRTRHCGSDVACQETETLQGAPMTTGKQSRCVITSEERVKTRAITHLLRNLLNTVLCPDDYWLNNILSACYTSQTTVDLNTAFQQVGKEVFF